MQITSEHLQSRCEVCHRSDCFLPEKNFCLRCGEQSDEIKSYLINHSRKLENLSKVGILRALMWEKEGDQQNLDSAIEYFNICISRANDPIMRANLIHWNVVLKKQKAALNPNNEVSGCVINNSLLGYLKDRIENIRYEPKAPPKFFILFGFFSLLPGLFIILFGFFFGIMFWLNSSYRVSAIILLMDSVYVISALLNFSYMRKFFAEDWKKYKEGILLEILAELEHLYYYNRDMLKKDLTIFKFEEAFNKIEEEMLENGCLERFHNVYKEAIWEKK
jgi:hypothetical protein